jgi:SAM-dependent methyltransferase
MSLQTLSEWLRCPNCMEDLSPSGALTLGCRNGHSFDVNRRGYVSLIAGSRRLIADSPTMLDARDHFLGAGWYQPLRDAVAGAVASASADRVLEAGCGTGYYLDGVRACRPEARYLGMDISAAGVARTVRRSEQIDGVVADVWSPLPIRTGAADVVLVVFAPRNAPEFHRVLRSDGMLVIAIPQDSHLQELRRDGLMIDVQPGKSSQLIGSLAGHFALEAQESIQYPMELGSEDVAALVGMGPSAHHTAADSAMSGRTVSAAFELLRFRREPLPHDSGSRTPA